MEFQSLFAQFFLLLQERIMCAVPEIRYIDRDRGQLEFYKERPAVSWPCVLIKFTETPTSDHGGGVQWMEPTVQLRLACTPYSSANSLTPDISKETALQFWELENKLFVAVQGFDAGGLIQPMTRVATVEEDREDPFIVTRQTYTTATQDDSAANAHNILQVPLLVEQEIITNA